MASEQTKRLPVTHWLARDSDGHHYVLGHATTLKGARRALRGYYSRNYAHLCLSLVDGKRAWSATA